MARAVVTTGSPVASVSMADSSASPAGPEMKPAAVQPQAIRSNWALEKCCRASAMALSR